MKVGRGTGWEEGRRGGRGRKERWKEGGRRYGRRRKVGELR